MNIEIAPMTIADYDEVVLLWQSVEGVGLLDFEDSREGISFYIDRNPGLSLVARQNGALAGAVLCGHDGRRGNIHHLAVAMEFRRQRIGQILVGKCLSELKQIGIKKCNIVVFVKNTPGRAFWKKLGWNERENMVSMQMNTDSGSPSDCHSC